MWAFLFLAEKRHQRVQSELLALHLMAARGEPREVRQQIKRLSGDLE